jgi:hypothetical protein
MLWNEERDERRCENATLVIAMLKLLTSNETAALLRMPESGMGYQVVDAVERETNRTQRGVAYNAELFAPDETAAADRVILLTKSYKEALRAASSAGARFKEFRLVTDHRTTVLSMSMRAAKASGGADAAAEEATTEGEVFNLHYSRVSEFRAQERLRVRPTPIVDA